MMRVQPPQGIDALFAQADAFERSGRLIEAIGAFQRVLARDPRHHNALVRLGLLALRTGNPREAVARFEAALRVQPHACDTLNNLAMLYLHLNRPDKALPYAEASHARNPTSRETLKILFKCAFQLGRAGEARAHLQKALALHPNDPELTLDLAQTWDMSGEPGKAAALYRKLIASGAALAAAYDGLARCETYSTEPPAYAEMTALLARPKLSASHRRRLHGALGKIDQDLGRTAQAFAHFAALRSPQAADDSVRNFAAYVARAKQLFGKAFFAERSAYANPSDRPVFIVGMPRSGTTLVDRIVSSHPQAHSTNELAFFHLAVDSLFPKDRGGEGFADAVSAWPQHAAAELAHDYLALLKAHSPDARRVVDKMPHNFERLWLPALLFPNASFIHVRRNAAATCVSCYTQPLGAFHAYADDLGALGRYYLLYEELMAHWRAVLPIRLFEIDYEALVADPQGEARRLVDHLGLAWDDACLRFNETKRMVTTPSRRQVEEPIHARALDAWRRYERHLAPLFDALGADAAA
jgi:Flp pilus assembly protein TadD